MKFKKKYKINEYIFQDCFIKFLKDRHILNQYMSNFDIHFGFFPDMLNYNLIDSAFDWECANEGYDFWANIDEEWQLFIDKYINYEIKK